MELMQQIRENARKANKRIVLAEGMEERTLKAADIILSEGLARLVLLGNKEVIASKAKEWGLKNIDKAEIIDPENNPKADYYANMLYELRKAKGVDMEKARIETINK